MQTFLPYADFAKTAQCLDMRRLGKQRVETWQLYISLTTENYSWAKHPASKMWKGHELALLHYGATMCKEWIHRGYKDTMLPRFEAEITKQQNQKLQMPKWFGDPLFHISHQSNLLRKLPEYYSKFNWNVSNDLAYVWPGESK